MAEDPVERLARGIVDGTVPFPYKKSFLDPPETYFANLRRGRYVDVQVNRQFPASRGGRQACASWRFDGKFVSMVVAEEAYGDVDTMTDLFTEEARMAARVRRSQPPATAWRAPEKARQIARTALASAGEREASAEALREACYEHLRECTLFKVTLSEAVYRYFLGARVAQGESVRALDPFAGWGDRALGAAAAGVEYVGVDPNSALAEGHADIKRFVGRRGRSVDFFGAKFEDFAADRADVFDIVFTSPPFFDFEIYSEEESQSIADRSGSCASRPERLRRWLDEWFLPVTDLAWGLLAPGGCLAYYLPDAGGEISGPLVAHMEKNERAFRGVIACGRRARRPLPLLVWRKAPADASASESDAGPQASGAGAS